MNGDFIAFPVRIGQGGWLARSPTPEETVTKLLKIMITTPKKGWRGSSLFGLRELFADLGTKGGLQITAVKQINQALEDLGIEWVRVEKIEVVPPRESSISSYNIVLVYSGKGVEVHPVDI
jgi:hypothetical protein